MGIRLPGNFPGPTDMVVNASIHPGGALLGRPWVFPQAAPLLAAVTMAFPDGGSLWLRDSIISVFPEFGLGLGDEKESPRRAPALCPAVADPRGKLRMGWSLPQMCAQKGNRVASRRCSVDRRWAGSWGWMGVRKSVGGKQAIPGMKGSIVL